MKRKLTTIFMFCTSLLSYAGDFMTSSGSDQSKVETICDTLAENNLVSNTQDCQITFEDQEILNQLDDRGLVTEEVSKQGTMCIGGY